MSSVAASFWESSTSSTSSPNHQPLALKMLFMLTNVFVFMTKMLETLRRLFRVTLGKEQRHKIGKKGSKEWFDEKTYVSDAVMAPVGESMHTGYVFIKERKHAKSQGAVGLPSRFKKATSRAVLGRHTVRMREEISGPDTFTTRIYKVLGMPTEEHIAYANEVHQGRAHGHNLVHPALRLDPNIIRGDEANELVHKLGYRSLAEEWVQHHP